MSQYDVIIIGTGAGGGTLARHLAPSGKQILLLDRLRAQDFGELKHHDGLSPAWPIGYGELEPYYRLALLERTGVGSGSAGAGSSPS